MVRNRGRGRQVSINSGEDVVLQSLFKWLLFSFFVVKRGRQQFFRPQRSGEDNENSAYKTDLWLHYPRTASKMAGTHETSTGCLFGCCLLFTIRLTVLLSFASLCHCSKRRDGYFIAYHNENR